MASSNKNKSDVGKMLSGIHLDIYESVLHENCYYTISDCEKLNDGILKKMGVSLTGHRKRILNKIQDLLGNPVDPEFVNPEAENNEGNDFSSECRDCGASDAPADKDTLAKVPENSKAVCNSEEDVRDGKLPIQQIQSEDSGSSKQNKEFSGNTLGSDSKNCLNSLENIQQDDSPTSGLFEYQGPMVENPLYDETGIYSVIKKTQSVPSRSFILRNRPVPELPSSAVDTFNRSRDLETRNATEEDIEEISPYEETFFFRESEHTKETLGEDIQSTNDTEFNGDLPEANASPLDNLLRARSSPDLNRNSDEESLYSTMEETSGGLGLDLTDKSKSQSLSGSRIQSDNASINQLEALSSKEEDFSISPYACFYRPLTNKEGWLEKLSPHRTSMYQKRWVKVDRQSISYYFSDRDIFSKGKIFLAAVTEINLTRENKLEIVTSQRTFVFRVEKDGDRQDWVKTMQYALKLQSKKYPLLHNSEKNGYLELKGYKSKMFTALNGNKLWISKSKQDANVGIYITDISMSMVSIKGLDRKGFEITTPFRTFCFTAESENERQGWMEAVRQSIAETLADYEVAEKIWFNESNRSCADCNAPNPDWASINLGVVICKNCAGHHRVLGSNISKVHSLKLDSSIWSNELVELFITVGNEKVNSYWEANLLSGSKTKVREALNINQRRLHITHKYKEGRFKKTYSPTPSQAQLNEALCKCVITSDVLETMILIFRGADTMCTTGDNINSTPYLLAKEAGQRLQMEFLHHNRFSDYNVSHLQGSGNIRNSYHCGFLYKAASSSKIPSNKKLFEDMKKWWCTIEESFLYYHESENSVEPDGFIDLSEGLCLVVHPSDPPDPSLNSGAFFTFEIYLLSERMFLFGTENAETQREWTKAIVKNFVPSIPECLTNLDFNIIGYQYYKDSYSLNQWKEGWFVLEKSCLRYCHEQETNQVDVVQLKKLQELTISSSVHKGEKNSTLLLVENGRTLYIHGHTMLDFMIWHSAIEKAAGTDGNRLQDQQLSKNNIPIIVNSCIAFVTQYGLGSKSLYLKKGNPENVRELLEDFRKDARSIKLKVGKHQLEDVTDVLKCFLYEIDDALLTKELYPYWISALDIQDEQERAIKFKTIIETLPALNKATLAALIEHLYRINKCSDINHLNTLVLASAFSSCLFQTNGLKDIEASVVENLITYYEKIFQVSEEQLQQMDTENRFITKWKDGKITQSGDLLIEVYLEIKDPDNCLIIRASPSMDAAELSYCAVGIKNITATKDALWSTFEVIENGELERLLHCNERILDTVLQWNMLPDPGSAYLLVKPFCIHDISQGGKKASNQMQTGSMKFKEEPSKLLAGNKFQERYFVLEERKLILYKDIKATKPERTFPVVTSKVYIGVKKKLKPPTSWGLTIYFEKYQWLFCCETKEAQMEWWWSFLNAQHPGDVFPLRRNPEQTLKAKNANMKELCTKHEMETARVKQTDLDMKPRSDKMMLQLNQTLSREDVSSTSKQRSSMLAEVSESKEDGKRNKKKHYSLLNLHSPSNNDSSEMPSMSSEMNTLDQYNKLIPASSVKMPPTLIKELNSVILKTRRNDSNVDN
uniref:ArfGAP with RhoGAP domain, ankyrin repeat and PH domain 2 n=1 Tax=Leptobrachium leishanense TaxID=445787 RepID=A0A8C5P6W5_9ANUR